MRKATPQRAMAQPSQVIVYTKVRCGVSLSASAPMATGAGTSPIPWRIMIDKAIAIDRFSVGTAQLMTRLIPAVHMNKKKQPVAMMVELAPQSRLV